ncbi:MAG: hypothetical protein E6J28_13975 [Chloroflexi bacterium]|nr:MAG: hypothetical protein E6J28_13975 [Chloroflexota bacterium]
MTNPVELTPEEVTLVLDALSDATVFRDSRSHVLQRAVRLRGWREEGSRPSGADAGEADRRKSREYEALSLKLRRGE